MPGENAVETEVGKMEEQHDGVGGVFDQDLKLKIRICSIEAVV